MELDELVRKMEKIEMEATQVPCRVKNCNQDAALAEAGWCREHADYKKVVDRFIQHANSLEKVTELKGNSLKEIESMRRLADSYYVSMTDFISLMTRVKIEYWGEYAEYFNRLRGEYERAKSLVEKACEELLQVEMHMIGKLFKLDLSGDSVKLEPQSSNMTDIVKRLINFNYGSIGAIFIRDLTRHMSAEEKDSYLMRFLNAVEDVLVGNSKDEAHIKKTMSLMNDLIWTVHNRATDPLWLPPASRRHIKLPKSLEIEDIIAANVEYIDLHLASVKHMSTITISILYIHGLPYDIYMQCMKEFVGAGPSDQTLKTFANVCPKIDERMLEIILQHDRTRMCYYLNKDIKDPSVAELFYNKIAHGGFDDFLKCFVDIEIEMMIERYLSD